MGFMAIHRGALLWWKKSLKPADLIPIRIFSFSIRKVPMYGDGENDFVECRFFCLRS